MRKLLLLSLIAVTVFSCSKKSDPIVPDEDDDEPVNKTALQLMIDTAAGRTFQFYLWSKNLPEYYNYNHANLNSFMTWTRTFSTETGFTQPVDRWSFAVEKSVWDNVSGGIAGDFGFDIFYLDNNDLRIRNVEKAGPAAEQGLKRGFQITKINNNTNVGYANVNAVVEAIYNATSVNLELKNHAGSTITVTVNAKTYTQNPFALDSVYTAGSKKVGYMVYNSFLGDINASKNKYAAIFSKFENENISELILDLRYNGGGYTNLSSELFNYIVPAGNDGDILSKDIFNEHNSDWDTTTPVKKKGSLNLNNLYIIVGANTASASEVIINSLKPYLNVQLIGNNNTHGKPVGYFAIPVGNHYVFPVSIRTVNKQGSGNYFNGFAPNHAVYDGVDYDWGNINESSLAKALQLIGGIPTRTDNARQEQITSRMAVYNKPLNRIQPFGYIKQVDATKLQEKNQQLEIRSY